jgi:uncharacterized Zn finger protein
VKPLAHVLHRDELERLAGGRTYARGERYAAEGRVLGLERDNGRLQGSVRGLTGIYRVKIWTSPEGVAYDCTCPVGEEGSFCKHAVAVAIVWLDQVGSTSDSAR